MSNLDLGATVRERRRARGWSQAELAEIAGVGRRFVSELENGKTTLRIAQVRRVLEVFGLDLTVAPIARDPGDD